MGLLDFFASILLTCEHLIENSLLLDLYWRIVITLPISFGKARCFVCRRELKEMLNVKLEVRSDSEIILASHTANSLEFLERFLKILKGLGIEVKIK